MRKIMISLPDALIEKLDKIAGKRELSRSMLIRQIVESGLKDT